MNFRKLEQLVDVRASITGHKTKQFPVVGIERKEDIALHHSLTKMHLSGSNAEGYANYHVYTLGWPGIGYHFVIEENGTIKWCNNLDLRTYHVGNFNNQAIGICLSGDFRIEQPTDAQKQSLRHLVEALKIDLPNYKRTLGHNDYPGYARKQCPVFDWKSVLASKSIAPITLENSTHVIKKGDTLWEIAAGNHITVAKLLSLNPNLDPYHLRIGQTIQLAAGKNREVIGHATVLVPFLNRRAEASFNSKITGAIRKGQQLEVYGIKNGLYDIGSLGWISAGTKYTRFEPTISELPNGILRRGDRGEGVKQLQRALNTVNFHVGEEDGIFGRKTKDGVSRFQSVYLPNEIDGIYGPNTKRELERRLLE
ncbi:hypothetical protein BKP45_06775 [Anaerobacillus alkalidiazotrophicus]|uniref:Autolysin n=1 Tax=Anaerobacillus alkalidiazotrophicus TaxID=472963 RepID=A0A1S2MEQ1_9BACI|nr:N-acetylmuramoyl-L-alanine amidase [Anaerobacillus alkalidiazotrophicus]OIJ22337.1 hypothetical protein BKP45_06775 [Anaerobacillus alkalidiazotrophicus]